jgi:hypothetical protein
MTKQRENPAVLDERITTNPAAEGIVTQPPDSSRRVGDRTNVHDAGSDANDTIDGLTESEEAVRQAAEDIPTGQSRRGPTEEIPVFDRGDLPPKV